MPSTQKKEKTAQLFKVNYYISKMNWVFDQSSYKHNPLNISIITGLSNLD